MGDSKTEKGRTFVEDIKVECYNDTIDIIVTATSPDDDMEDIDRLAIKRSNVSELIRLLESKIYNLPTQD